MLPGMIVIYPFGECPEGFLPLDGKCYHREISEGLFSILKPLTSLATDPPDTFRLPDPRINVPELVVRFIIKT